MALIECYVDGIKTVRVHGIYENMNKPGATQYRLIMWRVSFDSTDVPGERSEGDWHKVDRRKDKKATSLPLIADYEWVSTHRIGREALKQS